MKKTNPFRRVRALRDDELVGALTNHTQVLYDLIRTTNGATRAFRFLFWWILVVSAAIIYLAVR